jgi:lipoic acid synthetase
MRDLKLNTVCEEAACPNIGECWTKKHATVMILGRYLHPGLRVLQRQDRDAASKVDPLEPEHVALAAAKMGLEHIVITSVDRDDLPDGGASQFVKVIEALRANTPAYHDRDFDPGLSRQDASGGRGDRSGGAGCLQPQS